MMTQCNGKLHEDNEHGNASDVCILLFHIPGRSWYLLDCQCCRKKYQQLVINRHLDKMNIDDLVNENMKKMEAKSAKEGLPPQKITNQAHQSAKNINKTVINKGTAETTVLQTEQRRLKNAYEKARNAKPGSITAKANLVRDLMNVIRRNNQERRGS